MAVADWIRVVPTPLLLIAWLLCLVTFAGGMTWGMSNLNTNKDGTLFFKTYIDSLGYCFHVSESKSSLTNVCLFGSGAEFKKACLVLGSEDDCAFFDLDDARRTTYAFIIIAFIVLTIRLMLANLIQKRFCPGPRSWNLAIILDIITTLCMIVALGVYQSGVIEVEFYYKGRTDDPFHINVNRGFIIACLSVTCIVVSLVTEGYIKYTGRASGSGTPGQRPKDLNTAPSLNDTHDLEEEEVPQEWQ